MPTLKLVFLKIAVLLLCSSCSTTKYREVIDPNTGMVVEREFSTGANVNTLTSGDLGNVDSTTTGLFGLGGGGRTTNVQAEAVTEFAKLGQPTIKSGEFEFYGTLDHSTPIAAQGRSATGLLAEVRKLWVRVTGIEALRDVELGSQAVDTTKIVEGETTARVVDSNATRVASESIKADSVVELERIANP